MPFLFANQLSRAGENVVPSGCETRRTEAIVDVKMGRFPHEFGAAGVAHEHDNRGGKLIDGLDRNDEAGDAVTHGERHFAHVRHDCGQTRLHGFMGGYAQALDARWLNVSVQAG